MVELVTMMAMVVVMCKVVLPLVSILLPLEPSVVDNEKTTGWLEI